MEKILGLTCLHGIQSPLSRIAALWARSHLWGSCLSSNGSSL